MKQEKGKMKDGGLGAEFEYSFPSSEARAKEGRLFLKP